MSWLRATVGKITQIPGAGRFPAMEGIRAYAVVLTFFVHFFTLVFQWTTKQNPNHFNVADIYDQTGQFSDAVIIWLFRSQYGVDLFFILSGFLIYRMLVKGTPSYLGYMKSRLLRIYPVFLGSLAIAIWAKTWLMPQMDLSLVRVLKSLVLVDVGYNTPAWSLRYELVFYALMPALMLIAARLGGSVPARLLLVTLFVYSVWLSGFPRFSMFFVGALVASYSNTQLSTLASRVPDWVVIAGFLSITTAYAFYPSYRVLLPGFGVTFSLFFVAAVFGKGALNKFFTLTPLRFLGNISYSFYMIHGPSLVIGLWLSFKIVGPADVATRCATVGLFAFAVSLILSVAMFLMLEFPYFSNKARAKSEVAPVSSPAQA
jgi:exopolysaccharide production protein ExoZ